MTHAPVAKSAADQLATQHLDFARALVHRLKGALPPHVDGDALESDAMLGLLVAARSFDPSRGVSFRTYASKRILGSMLDGLRERQGGSRRNRPPAVVSLSALVYEGDGRPTTLGEVLADDQAPVGAALERQDEVEHLIRHLDPQCQAMVRQYYLEGMTQPQIGQQHELSASRVSQRLKLARTRLKEIALSN